MKVVIDIPKDLYDMTRTSNNVNYLLRMAGFICSAVANGVPLPKGHGRLVILSENKLKENQINLDSSCQKWISEVGLSNATVTIIEADKKSEDKE